MDTFDLFGDKEPKRRKLDDSDYQNFKAQFLLLKEKLFKRLGNDTGLQTLQKNFNLFGIEESITIIQESNIPESDVIRLGIPLCEGLGIPASEIYLQLVTCCINEIVEAMYKGVPENHARLKDLMPILDDFIGTRFLNRITITAFDILPKPDNFTQYYPILDDKEAMEFCPLGVKQLLWKNNPTHFRNFVLPLIKKYTSDPQIRDQSYEINSPIISFKLKTRQEHSALLDLVNLVGTQVELYNYVTDALAELYSQYGLVVYCNLRFDLLMTFHRLKILSICNSDPIYSFVWGLDAAILKNSPFKERLPSLYQELHKWKPKFNDRNHVALGMVLRANFAMDWLARQAFEFIYTGQKPLSELNLLFNLMEIGFSSRLTVKCGKQPKLSNDIPKAISDMIFCLSKLIAKIPQYRNLSDKSMQTTIDSMITLSNPDVIKLCKSIYMASKCNAIACALMNQFVLHRFKDNDYVSISVILSVLRQLIRKSEIEKYEVSTIWENDFLPDFIHDTAKQADMSFSKLQGILDPYFPLVHSFLLIYYQQPERASVLFSSKVALHLIVWKFLVPIAFEHELIHQAVLDLIIHIQSLISNHPSSSIQYYSSTIVTLIDIVEKLLSNWGLDSAKHVVDPLKFAKSYRQIGNYMVSFGSKHYFQTENAPNTVKFLDHIMTHKLI